MVLLASHAPLRTPTPLHPQLPQLFSTFTSGQRGVCAICLLIYALLSSNLCVEQAKASATPTSPQCWLLLLLLLLLLLCCSNFMNYCWLIRLLARRDMALPLRTGSLMYSVCAQFPFYVWQKMMKRGNTQKEREKGRESGREGGGKGTGLDGLVSVDVTRSGNCVRRE